MRDRRSVDDLSIEELEQVLRMKKRQARMERLRRYEQVGRRRGDVPVPDPVIPAVPAVPFESEAVEEAPADRPPRTLRDHLLLAVEIAAVLGLVAMLVFGARTVQQINREAAAAQAQAVADIPTPSPTPLITAVVLPSGHTPPTAPGGGQPNYDEVPPQLRPLVEQQFAGPIIVPTAAPGNAIRIRIPAIRVDAPVVMGDGWEQLQKGVAQHLGTANPGENGNMVLSAHNDIFGEIFRDLELLQEGDEVILDTPTQSFTYIVVRWRIVDPTDVSVMEPTREPVVTLISCYPYLVDSHRIVVLAELKTN